MSLTIHPEDLSSNRTICTIKVFIKEIIGNLKKILIGNPVIFPIARDFWKRNFKNEASWDDFRRILVRELKLDDIRYSTAAELISLSDILCDSNRKVSLPRFSKVIAIFGDLPIVLQNVNDIMNKKWFWPHLETAEESCNILQDCPIGSFVVRINSRTTQLVISVVRLDQDNQQYIDDCLITQISEGLLSIPCLEGEYPSLDTLLAKIPYATNPIHRGLFE